MTRYWKYCLMILIALAVMVPAASARPYFRGGFYGPGFYGGGFYGPAYYGYGPGFYGPGYGWYGSSWGYRSSSRATTGKVKIETKMKDAMVYVDGGYAGTVRDLKTFELRPGNHDIELRSPDGHSFYQERVDVLAGKTAKLVP